LIKYYSLKQKILKLTCSVDIHVQHELNAFSSSRSLSLTRSEITIYRRMGQTLYRAFSHLRHGAIREQDGDWPLLCRFAASCVPRLDPHTDTGVLTPSADWIMRCFNIAFCLLFTPIIRSSPISARCQSAGICMRIQPKTELATIHLTQMLRSILLTNQKKEFYKLAEECFKAFVTLNEPYP